MQNDNEIEFDWVTARKACSIEAVYERLLLGVQTDLETRQKLREKTEFGFEEAFGFASHINRFSATRKTSPQNRRSVTFILRDGHIILTDENDKEFMSATVTITDDRQCRIVVNGEELEDWQFRKRALEPLFFG